MRLKPTEQAAKSNLDTAEPTPLPPAPGQAQIITSTNSKTNSKLPSKIQIKMIKNKGRHLKKKLPVSSLNSRSFNSTSSQTQKLSKVLSWSTVGAMRALHTFPQLSPRKEEMYNTHMIGHLHHDMVGIASHDITWYHI